MNEARDVAFTALDTFKGDLAERFIWLCDGRDGRKLTLLKIYDTIDEIYSKHIHKWLDAGTVDSSPTQKWISVYDGTPTYDTDVLVYTITGEKCVASCSPCYEAEGVKDVFYANNKQLVVTHWMPLPAAPKEVE